MKLVDIYEILKQSNLDDFFTPIESSKFVYKEDVNLCIEENEKKENTDVFGYDYFHDAKRNVHPHILANPNDKLVYDACKLKDFSESYDRGTSIVTWDVKYCNNVIFELHYVKVSNLSSLYIMLPLSIDIEDYIYNFANIWNEENSPNSLFNLESRLNVLSTTFDIFLKK